MRTTIVLTTILAWGLATAAPLGTGFSYQGELEASGALADGLFDFQFELFDAASNGGSAGGPIFLDDVAVTNGVFSVELDFGTGPFAGDQLWLEIGVRDGADTVPHQLLNPRQKLSATPYALHAEMVAMDAIGGAEIANNSVSAADIAGNAVGASELANNAVDSAAIVNGAITAADLGRGSVDSSAILDGTVSGIDLARESVGSGHLAANSVGTSEIITSQVQRRVSGVCPSGQYLRGIKENGSILCELVPKDQVINTVSTGYSSWISMTIGSDGWPVISHSDTSSLVVTRCLDATCSGRNFSFVDFTSNFVGLYSSIAIGVDGWPVISYHDFSDKTLKVAHCNDLDCANSTVTTVDDPANDVGSHTSIAIGADDWPVIAYYDETAAALKVAHCTNAACTSSFITTVDDPANDVGTHTSIAIGSDGLPVISYYDATAGALKVAHCLKTACTTKEIATVDDPANVVGLHSSIAIGGDALPVISYFDSSAGTLKVAHCTDPACTASTITTVDDSNNSVGLYSSIAIGAEGWPMISYYDNGAAALKVARCTDPTCAGRTIVTVDDPGNFVGEYTAIAIGTDGLPVIAYRDQTADTVKFARCGLPDCTL